MTASKKPPLPLQSKISDEMIARPQAKRRLTKLLTEREPLKGEKPAPTLWLTAEAAPFILHILVREDATLRDLDRFFRDVWMECCGHMSLFQYRAKDERTIIYTADPEPEWDDEDNPFLKDLPPAVRAAYLAETRHRHPLEKPLTTKLAEAFADDVSLRYEYDMGTTTYVQLKVIKRLETAWPAKNQVRLIARNVRPEWKCRECGEAATRLCTMNECWEDGYAKFCATHAKTHPKQAHPREGGDWMMAPLSNSPRDPCCGYAEGPKDEEPYVWR